MTGNPLGALVHLYSFAVYIFKNAPIFERHLCGVEQMQTLTQQPFQNSACFALVLGALSTHPRHLTAFPCIGIWAPFIDGQLLFQELQ
jgi:hypothetical protein